MAVFKCKICGGTLEINVGETVATCEYCGTKQTLPKLDDEKKANLFDRANHFRRNNDFDKAMGIYEQILNEDTEDAESYWSIVLCRYGIEYVEDPSSRKRVPTVNRAQFTSVYDDEDYKSAIKYADSYQKNIYEAEAAVINEIQKGILAISQKEEPFDVFICYKETDNNGRRTQDSVLATELYHELAKEGFKVFFSRITLEDKLGVAYEPYIFAALHSAKVMVALGTKPEHFNAVWVKNEWARYLSLIKNGANKILIPAYRDMDPYDLPEEFSHLQAQDMSKLGFMQDLVRGIKKLVSADTSSGVRETVVIQNSASGNASALVKRGFLALEDGEWEKADEFFEQALNHNAEDAQAYLGKLMAELKVSKQENLAECKEPFDKNSNYEKIIRFGDKTNIGFLHSCIDFINTRNENNRLAKAYTDAVQAMNVASTEEDYKSASKLFGDIIEFKDSELLAKECDEKAEIARKNSVLSLAKLKMSGTVISNYENVINLLGTIPGWKDADEQISVCKRKIEEIKLKEEADRIELEKVKNRNKKIVIILAPIICVLIVFMIVLNTVIIPTIDRNRKYKQATEFKTTGNYEQAIQIFKDLGNYNNSLDVLEDTIYLYALQKMDNRDYKTAIDLLEQITKYKDSAELLKEAKYIEAINTFDAIFQEKTSEEDIEDIIDFLATNSNYKDSNKYVTYYNAVCSNDINSAIEKLNSLPKDFYDVQTRLAFLNDMLSLCGNYTSVSTVAKGTAAGDRHITLYDLVASISSQNPEGVRLKITGLMDDSKEYEIDDVCTSFKFSYAEYLEQGKLVLEHVDCTPGNMVGPLYVSFVDGNFVFDGKDNRYDRYDEFMISKK